MNNRIDFSYPENIENLLTQEMGIKIESILPALAEHLYGGDWTVSIRELLQNAQDAITERIIASRTGKISLPYDFKEPRIRIYLDEASKSIIFEDDGIGLSEEEIHSKMATIGACGKRILDSKPEDRGEVKNLIGQFGIGFLSIFIIGQEVVVYSQAADTTYKPVMAVFSGQTSYRYGLYSKSLDVGTRIVVRLKPRYSDPRQMENYLLDYQNIELAIRTYADNLTSFISVHMDFKDSGTLINIQNTPWDSIEPTIDQLQSYLKRRPEDFGDIAFVKRFNFTLEEHGIDATGVFYIPQEDRGYGINFPHPYPNLLFVRRMFVAYGVPKLLPSGILFAAVVVECPDLTLNLSRDRVFDHESNFILLQQCLADFAVTACSEWASKASFKQWYLNNIHRITASIAASNNQEPSRTFFRVMTPAIPFEVHSSKIPRGQEMTLAQYVDVAQNERTTLEKYIEQAPQYEFDILYLYLKVDMDHGRLRVLTVEQPYPVIYVDDTEKFIIINFAKEQSQAQNLRVRALDVRTLWDAIDPASKSDSEKLIRLQTLCMETDTRLGINEVKVGQFQPTYLPAILLAADVDKGVADMIDQFLNQGIGVLPPQIVATLSSQSKYIRLGHAVYTLYLNANSEIIKRLADSLEKFPNLKDVIVNILNELILIAGLPLFDLPDLSKQLMVYRTKNTLEFVESEIRAHESNQENLLLRADINRRLDPNKAIDVGSVPEKAEKRECAVLLLDLVKSTWMLGNLDIADGGRIFEEFVILVANLVHEFNGHFDKFTGDGLLAEFFANEKSEGSRRIAIRNAFECAKRLTDEIDNFYRDEPWRNMLIDANLVGPTTRTALSWGVVNFGRYGGAGTAVGSPMVIAARLCNNKEFFLHTGDKPESRIIGTGQILQVLEFRPADIAGRLIEKDWHIEGLTPTDVFRLHP